MSTLGVMPASHPPATVVRRSFAVFVDFVFYFAAFAAVGFTGQVAIGPYVLPAILVFDWLLTSMLGVSFGRLVTGIRVLRPDGRVPGLGRGAIRTAVVFVTGLPGVYVFSLQVTHENAAAYRMWWDVLVDTSVVRIGRPPQLPDLDHRTAVLRGFRLTEDDLMANASGRQSTRQRHRTFIRAGLYAAGFAVAVLVTSGLVFDLVTHGFSLSGLIASGVAAVATLGIYAYSDEIWHDAISGRVVAHEGVPTKGIERDETMGGGGAWTFPYLDLFGVHKLGRRAYDSIVAGRRYRIYVLPASGRCIGAVPLD